MPVNARGDSWQASVSHQGKRYRRDFPSKKEAKIWEAQAKADLLTGKSITEDDKPEVNTLQDLYDITFRLKWKGTRGEKTAKINATHVVRILGPERDVSDLNRTDLITIRDELMDVGNSPATINRKLSAFSTMVREAETLKWIAKRFSPELRREGAGRIRWLKPGEEEMILDWCCRWAYDDLWDYIVVSVDTGFRQGEVLRIVKQDAGNDNLWSFKTKNYKNRDVPLTTRAREVLERRAGELKGKDDRLFPLDSRIYRNQWWRMAAALGLDADVQFIPHCLRHTFVTRLLQRGVDIKTVMELAGHKRIETTQRYAQTSAETKYAAISKLNG